MKLVVHFQGDVLFEDVEFLTSTGMTPEQALESLPIGKYLAIQAVLPERMQEPAQRPVRFDELRAGMHLYGLGFNYIGATVESIIHRRDRSFCVIWWLGDGRTHVFDSERVSQWAWCAVPSRN